MARSYAPGIARQTENAQIHFLMKTMDGLRFGMAEVDACCKERGIFQDKFGFGASPR